MMAHGGRSSIAVESPIGPLTLSARAGSLVEVRFDDRRPIVGERTPELNAAAAQLEEYFAGRRRAFDLPVALPYGERRAYGSIAAELGLPAERSRDVGGALGRNPLPIVLPCHRVVGADGGLTGYGGGLERKAFLLALESPQLVLQ